MNTRPGANGGALLLLVATARERRRRSLGDCGLAAEGRIRAVDIVDDVDTSAQRPIAAGAGIVSRTVTISPGASGTVPITTGSSVEPSAPERILVERDPAGDDARATFDGHLPGAGVQRPLAGPGLGPGVGDVDRDLDDPGPPRRPSRAR